MPQIIDKGHFYGLLILIAAAFMYAGTVDFGFAQSSGAPAFIERYSGGAVDAYLMAVSIHFALMYTFWRLFTAAMRSFR